jgi:hypothetical protein
MTIERVPAEVFPPSEYFKGPWKRTRPYFEESRTLLIDIQDADGVLVAVVPYDKGDKEGCIARLRLLLATPELLEACKAIIRWLGESHEGPSLDLARAAIAKAEGRDKCQSPDK